MYSSFVQSGELLSAKVFAPSRGLSSFPDQLGRIQQALYLAQPEFNGSLRLQIVDEGILTTLDERCAELPKYVFNEGSDDPQDDEFIQLSGSHSAQTIDECLEKGRSLNPLYMVSQSMLRLRANDRALLQKNDPKERWTPDDQAMWGRMVGIIHFVALEPDYERNSSLWRELAVITALSTGNHGYVLVNPEVFSGMQYKTASNLAAPVSRALLNAVLAPIPTADMRDDIRAGGFDFCDINAHVFEKVVGNALRPAA